MKKVFLSLFILAFVGAAHAQIENPVTWTFSSKKIDSKTYEIHMTALVDGKWHIYSQNSGEGPVPTEFTFDKNPIINLDGKVAEIGKLEKEFSTSFNSLLKFYSQKVDFVQKIKLKSAIHSTLKGNVLYMVCNDKKCLSPTTRNFSIKLE